MKSSFLGKHLVSVETFTRETVEQLCKRADEMKLLVEQKGGDERLKGKIMAALFYEPSSRTFSSFISAMQRLGGGIIPLNGMSHTSVAKGETLEDTVRVFSSYADVLVIRHPEPGSVKIAAKYASVPVINAGDGIGEHPTQALIDLYTIKEKFGNVENLHILMIGDLAHYRPTNSLAKLLAIYPKIKLSFATPKQVPLPDLVRQYLKNKKISFREYFEFSDLLPTVDVLYVTRVKKEYMSEELYHQVQGSYVIDRKIVNKMKKNSAILHCLPRVGEIHQEVDNDPRALYFNKQVKNGMYMRMALLDSIIRG